MRRAFQLFRQHQEELLLFIAIAFGFVLVIRPIFHLSFFQSLLVAVPAAAAFVATFSWLLRRRRHNQNLLVAVEHHPEFGEVRLFPERWQAVVSGSPFPSRIEVTGGSKSPSTQQSALFREVRKRYDSLFAAAMDKLSDEMQTLKPPAKKEDLVLSSIWIDSVGSAFSFTFDVPTRRNEVPDGFYADFAEFEIQEAGWVH